jgi:hypothetical protein
MVKQRDLPVRSRRGGREAACVVFEDAVAGVSTGQAGRYPPGAPRLVRRA